MDEARRIFGTDSRIAYAESPLAAVSGADALAVVTEWKEFRSPDFVEIKRRLKAPLIFDGRNLYEPARMKSLGFQYFPIGRRT
ncbi:MAG: ugd [Proteobacteria bacterium]|nr:ugd [Pseudomonadota bacterium]